jgi:hypothetical protein
VSPSTAFGIILTVALAISIVVVGVMFWWGAREDGRDQKLIDARLGDDPEEGSRDNPDRQ